MTTLPFASTSVCRKCGADVKSTHYQYSLVETPAHSNIHTGNLCENCFNKVVDMIEQGE